MKTFKTFRNLNTFAKVQLLTFGVIMLTLLAVGFRSMGFKWVLYQHFNINN